MTRCSLPTTSCAVRAAGDRFLALVAEDGALVPALWPLEVGSVLAVAQRRKRLGEAHAARFVELLTGLPIAVDAAPPDIARHLGIALRHGLSTYDATCLELAEHRGLALATCDTGLRRAARRAGVALATGTS